MRAQCSVARPAGAAGSAQDSVCAWGGWCSRLHLHTRPARHDPVLPTAEELRPLGSAAARARAETRGDASWAPAPAATQQITAARDVPLGTECCRTL